MTKWVRIGLALAVLLIVGSLVTGCDGSGEGTGPTIEPTLPDTTAPPAETTSPPAETTAPPAQTTVAPDTDTDETPWWVLLIVLGAIFVLVIALLAGRRKKTPAAAVVPAWKTQAQSGYAESRWLYDNLTEQLAIWHGDAEFEGTIGQATDTEQARIWDQLAARMDQATADLYALEAAAAPNSPALGAAQSVVGSLKETYAAVIERSDARHGSHGVESGSSEAAEQGAELAAARDREMRASTALAAARPRLAAALTDLSKIT
jgi:hypothetical protein